MDKLWTSVYNLLICRKRTVFHMKHKATYPQAPTGYPHGVWISPRLNLATNTTYPQIMPHIVVIDLLIYKYIIMQNRVTRYHEVINDAVVLAISVRNNISEENILSRKRDRDSALCRHMVWYILRRSFKWSFTLIAHCYKRDHTAVIRGIRNIKKFGLKKEMDFIINKHFTPNEQNATSPPQGAQ